MNKERKNSAVYLTEPYLRVLTPDKESGTFTAEILEFPGCIAQGNTAQEAYERLEDAAQGWVESAIELKQDIPSPISIHEYGGKILLRLPKSMHRQVVVTAEREGTSLNQFIVSAISEKIGATKLYEKLIDRLESRSFHMAVSAAVYSINNIQTADSIGRYEVLPYKSLGKEVTYAGDKNNWFYVQGSGRGSDQIQ